MPRRADSPSASRTLRGAHHSVAQFCEYGAHFLDCPIERFALDRQWRSEPHDRAMRVLRQDSAREEPIDDVAGSDPLAIDFDADEKTLAANFPDQGTAYGRQSREQ